ncbi:MAG: cupin domain-containing protein [Gemmatimonadota bacterium]
MRITIAVTALLMTLAGAAAAQAPGSAPAQPELNWGPAPAIFPAGAQMAVLQGNPGGSGLFTVRLRMPNGYKIPPHTHPTDEHVTVISGTFLVGMGEKLDESKTMPLKAGGFVTAPAQAAHYAIARGPTIVQVHGIGPFSMTYVNPADTPSAANSK